MIKKKIGKIIRIFNENCKNSSVIKSLYIIHNNIKIKSDEDYYNYIKNNFPKEYYYNKDNLIFTEILGEEAEHKFEVLHFVAKTYKKEDEVIMTINTQIYSHLQIDICNFDEMVLNSFQKIDKILFNNECEIKIEDDNIKIKKKQNKDNSNLELENFSFNKTYIWSSIRITIPSYCCYVDENNDFYAHGYEKADSEDVEAQDIEPFKAGNYTWVGYTFDTMAFGEYWHYVNLVTEEDKDGQKLSVLLREGTGDKTWYDLDSEEVQYILSNMDFVD